MTLTIETYGRDRLEQMLALYNAETAHEPHIAPLTPERFRALIEQKSYFDPDGLLVAVEDGAVVGWAHACVVPGSETWHDQERPAAQLRMLIYPRTRLKVGHILVAEATGWLARSGLPLQLALHAQAGYPFYRGIWMGGEPMGPASMPHVQLALEVGGYKLTQESIFMTMRLDEAPSPRPVAGVELIEHAAEMKHATQRESWRGFAPRRTRALIASAEVGSIGWVIEPHVADRLGAPCMNIWALGVREEYRRKGIAAALIADALRSAYAQGARFASVGTQLWNAAAHATYASFGYVPSCLLIGRTREG